MSLDKNRPQSYAPLRLQQSQIEPFFNSIRDRRVTKGFDSDSTKVVTTKPFVESKPKYKRAKKRELPQKKADNQKKKKSVKKVKVDKRLKDVKL